MRQYGKFEKIRSQNPSNDEVFGQFLNIFPEAPKWMFCHPFDVFWCLEGQDLPRVILDRFREHQIFMKFFTFLRLHDVYLSTSRHPPKTDRFWQTRVESDFLWVKHGRKTIGRSNDYIGFSKSNFLPVNLFKMSLNKKIKINPQLTPYYSLGIQDMLYESLKSPPEARRQATHAPAWEIWEN